ncbi:MAG: primosomal protein N' [Gammaproteobacteria bacterium]|nr:primosomal protein N' [Gammaproteobacteria bacterium]
MSDPTILQVAVNVPLSRLFDYLPVDGRNAAQPGSRVVVPFGRQKQVGVIMALANSSDLPMHKLRRCQALLDEAPILSASDLNLISFASDYYHHPVGEVVAAALPALLRSGKPLLPDLQCVAITAAGAAADVEALARRAPRQAELLQVLVDAGGNGMSVDALNELLPDWRRAAKPLLAKELLTRFTRKADWHPPVCDDIAVPGPDLNEDQKRALESLRSVSGYAAFLLDGVTGSGKTEVYLQLIRDVLADSQQVLILVPEIGLTPQLVSRLRQRLGIEPTVLHSGLGDAERLAAWRSAQQGLAQLVVGTRSAVFTPLPKLGLIVVDEEHDHSLKQQEGLRYSARDLAIMRARSSNARVVLGSATPTLETLQHCRSGNFTQLRLPARAGGALPPRLRLVDPDDGTSGDGLGVALTTAIEQQLRLGGQVLLFLNRRGFAPTLICTGCGHLAECARCDSRMTVHARDRSLRCHHCGAQTRLPDSCAHCNAAVKPLGAGTERIEDVLLRRFPGYAVQRIDSDSTQQRGAIEAALLAAEQGDADILVGTQMLSKGHHFPKLTLVGVVNADQGLFGTDFRAAERLAQSIIQVAGRAGREAQQGEVLIQTAFPEHPFWRMLISGGYAAVAEAALAEREQSHWPPFTRLALLRANAHRQGDALAFLQGVAELIAARRPATLRVLGPVNAPMARKAGRYRAQLLLQSSDRKSLHLLLATLRPALEAEPAARKVRWSIDVDPIELF